MTAKKRNTYLQDMSDEGLVEMIDILTRQVESRPKEAPLKSLLKKAEAELHRRTPTDPTPPA